MSFDKYLHYEITVEYFHQTQQVPSVLLCSQLQSGQPLIWIVSLLVVPIKRIIQPVLVCVCLLSLSMILRCIHLVPRIFLFVCFIAEYYSIVWLYYSLLSFTCVDIWVVDNLGLLWIMLLWTSICKSLVDMILFWKNGG